MKTMQPKTFIFSFLLLLLLFCFLIFSTDAAQSPPTGVKIFRLVTVNPVAGKGNFTTIGAALAAAPIGLTSTSGYYLILIAKGVYNESLTVTSDRTFVMMVGSGIGLTIITGNKNAADGFGTYGSATFAIEAQGFVAHKITFRNTAGPAKQQAVAVRNSADQTAFYLCSFEGYQATLYAHQFKQLYRACDIYGTVDIIFGDAAAVFQNCNIYPRLPLPGQFNTITAQGRNVVTSPTGYSFQRCNISAAPDLASSPRTTLSYLGRPWGSSSRTVFMQSGLGAVVAPAGWAPWSAASATSTTIYYAEYLNTGPGAVTANRVKWPGVYFLNATAAAAYNVANFIGTAWLVGTGVPFSAK